MRYVVFTGVLLLAGCAATYTPPTLSTAHPAHTDATAAPYAPPSYALSANPVAARVQADAPAHAAAAHAHDAEAMPPAAPPADRASNTAPDTAPDTVLVRLADASAPAFRQLLDAYLAAGRLLAADNQAGLPAHAAEIGAALTAMTAHPVPDHPHFWHERAALLTTISGAAKTLAAASTLEPARQAYGRLSTAVAELVSATGVPAGYDATLQQFTCGMFTGAPDGGTWLQLGTEARNPYQGSAMRMCHSEHAPLLDDGAAAPAHEGHVMPAKEHKPDTSPHRGHGGPR